MATKQKFLQLLVMLCLENYLLSLKNNACHKRNDNCEVSNENFGDHKYVEKHNAKPKKIVYWTHFYGHRDFEFGLGQKPFIDALCPVSNCIATDNKEDAEDADALMFHMRNVNQNTVFPKQRKHHQMYVFFLLEHPYHQWNDLRGFSSFFNLTMTYRRDSDVPLLYGKVELSHPSELWKPKAFKSRKLVAWFVGNCNTNSKRELYVNELQKYIPVDIYGKCGTLKCPANKTVRDPRMQPECYEMLENNYKFYLSFENIFCKDYVTEKLFNILPLQVVPVVMGGTDYTRDAPPHSTINVQDFKSPRDLAAYLRQLDNNEDLYNEYFQWKQTHKIQSVRDSFKAGFCKLCEVLNNNDYEVKQYHDLESWWGKTKFCDINIYKSLMDI